MRNLLFTLIIFSVSSCGPELVSVGKENVKMKIINKIDNKNKLKLKNIKKDSI